MCGLFGCSPQTKLTRQILPFLAFAMEDRGWESWGVAGGGADRVVRKLGGITDSFEIPKWENLLYHTRLSTLGDVTIENQHPFTFWRGGVPIVGVHNGTVGNHGELNTKYQRNFAVDSMHVFAHIAEERPREEVELWGVIMWFEGKELRFGMVGSNALTVVRLAGGELVWCSDELPIWRAVGLSRAEVREKYTLTKGREYRVTVGKWERREIEDVGPLGFVSPRVVHARAAAAGVGIVENGLPWTDWENSDEQVYGVTASSTTSVSAGEGEKGRCFRCSAKLTDPKQEVICPGCLGVAMGHVNNPREKIIYV